MAQRIEDQTTHGVPVPNRQAVAQQFVQLVNRHTAVNPDPPTSHRLGQRFLLVEFVDDLADHLLEQVLHGHQTGGSPVLVDHDRQVEAARLHFSQQVIGLLGLRHESR